MLYSMFEINKNDLEIGKMYYFTKKRYIKNENIIGIVRILTGSQIIIDTVNGYKHSFPKKFIIKVYVLDILDLPSEINKEIFSYFEIYTIPLRCTKLIK